MGKPGGILEDPGLDHIPDFLIHEHCENLIFLPLEIPCLTCINLCPPSLFVPFEQKILGSSKGFFTLTLDLQIFHK
jgi:hypothetical protein